MDKPHILVTGFSGSEAFKPKTQGRGAGIPSRERGPHGQRLLQQYNQSLQQYEARRAEVENPITEDLGIYLEIRGAPGHELPLSSLDTTRDFRLRSLTTRDNQEVAVVFVPESRRATLARKLEAYLAAC